MAKKQKQAEGVSDDAAQDIQTVVTDVDTDGNSLLPSLEREFVVIPELAEAVKHNKLTLVPAFMDLKEKLSQSGKDIRALAEKHKDKLLFNEEEQTYTYDDGEVHLTVSEKPTVEFSVVKEG